MSDALLAAALREVTEQLRLANLMRGASQPFASGEALTALRVRTGPADAPGYRWRPEVAELLGLPRDEDGLEVTIGGVVYGDGESVVDAEIHCAGCQCPPSPCPDCGRTDVLSASHIVDCPGGNHG